MFGTSAGAAAGNAASLIEVATDTSAVAPAGTNIALTEAATTNNAAAGSVASSFSAGSQEAAETLKLKLLETDF